MKIERLKLADVAPDERNPRVDLTPDDPEYKDIQRSLAEFGLVEPLVYNERIGKLVSGHQRIKVLKAEGVEEADFSVVDLPEGKHRALVIALNKVGGKWDERKLAEELAATREEFTGFSRPEIEQMLADLERSRGRAQGTATPRVKLSLDQFKVFHATLMTNIHCMDGLNFILSYSVANGKPWQGVKHPNSLLFIDSGLLTGAKNEGRKYLDRQDDIVKFAENSEADWVAMLDVPQLPDVLGPLNLTPIQAYEYHLRNAEAFSAIKTPLEKVFVVQPRDPKQLVKGMDACCNDIKSFVGPNDRLALGGIRGIKDQKVIAEMVTTVREHFPGHHMHLFGVTDPQSVAYGAAYGADSCDSGYATQQLAVGQIVLAQPDGEGYIVKNVALSDLTNGNLNVAWEGALHKALAAFSMAMLQTAILANLAAAGIIESGSSEEDDESEAAADS